MSTRMTRHERLKLSPRRIHVIHATMPSASSTSLPWCTSTEGRYGVGVASSSMDCTRPTVKLYTPTPTHMRAMEPIVRAVK